MNQLLASNTVKYRLGFNECVKLALKNNDEIKASDYDIDVSKAKLQQASPRGIPVVKYEHKIGPAPQDIDNAKDSFFRGDITVFNSFRVEMGSAVSTFGKIKTAQDLAQLGIDASWFKRDQKADEVVYRIYQIFEGIKLARELLALADKAQITLDDKISELETKKVIDQLEILKLKVALYEVERRIEEAKKKEQLAISALKFQIGMEDDVDLDVTSSQLVSVDYALKPFDYYLETAKENRPEYQLLKAGVSAKEKQLKLAKLDYAPDLGVGGFFDIGRAPNVIGGDDESAFTNPFNYTKAGVGFQLKGKLDYVQSKSKMDEAKADLLKTVYQKRAAVKGLELDLKDTYLKLLEARSLKSKSANEIKAAKQMVFLTKSNLDVGLGDKKDYLDALQSYLIFQGRNFEAIYNFNVSVFELKKKTGELQKLYGRKQQ